jgi:hypothetical protein
MICHTAEELEDAIGLERGYLEMRRRFDAMTEQLERTLNELRPGTGAAIMLLLKGAFEDGWKERGSFTEAYASRLRATMEELRRENVDLRTALTLILDGEKRTDGYAPAPWIISIIRAALTAGRENQELRKQS